MMLLPLIAAAGINFSEIASVSIGTNEVQTVAINGETVWERPNPNQCPYVTDGLVAWWDGIWNAGLGVHDPSATTWPDLVGTYTMTESSPVDTWGNDHLTMGGTTWNITPKTQFVHLLNSPQRAGEAYGVEIVLSHNNQGNKCIFGHRYTTLDIHAEHAREQVWFKNGSDVNIGPSAGGLHSLSLFGRRDGSTSNQINSWYCNGALVQTVTRAYNVANDNDNVQAGVGLGQYPARGIAVADIYCIRFYNRILTADEIAANYAADKARFGLP